LAEYLNLPTDDEQVLPTDNQVVGIVEASGWKEEDEIIAVLNHLYHDRGLKPGTRNGPRHYAWFETVIQDYFDQRDRRFEAANPSSYEQGDSHNLAREKNKRVTRMDAAEVAAIAAAF
jgi:hypothetical protein